jgi:hypothetical protein
MAYTARDSGRSRPHIIITLRCLTVHTRQQTLRSNADPTRNRQ